MDGTRNHRSSKVFRKVTRAWKPENLLFARGSVIFALIKQLNDEKTSRRKKIVLAFCSPSSRICSVNSINHSHYNSLRQKSTKLSVSWWHLRLRRPAPNLIIKRSGDVRLWCEKLEESFENILVTESSDKPIFLWSTLCDFFSHPKSFRILARFIWRFFFSA